MLNSMQTCCVLFDYLSYLSSFFSVFLACYCAITGPLKSDILNRSQCICLQKMKSSSLLSIRLSQFYNRLQGALFTNRFSSMILFALFLPTKDCCIDILHNLCRPKHIIHLLCVSLCVAQSVNIACRKFALLLCAT